MQQTQAHFFTLFILPKLELNEYFPTYEKSIQEGQFSGTLKGKIKKVIGNKKTYFHFIPQHTDIDAGIIDFQDKLSIPIEELEEKIMNGEVDNFATISMPFLKDLIQRYSSYYARQGSPDFDADEIIEAFIQGN